MDPLPERGATIVPVVPIARFAISWPQAPAFEHERRFETPLDPGFADLVALLCVYVRAERGQYYAASCEDAERALDDPRVAWHRVDSNALVEMHREELARARTLRELRATHRAAIAAASTASTASTASATFEASVEAMRAIVRARGLAGFVAPADAPSVRALVLDVEPGTWTLGILDQASQYIDEALHLLVCAVLVGTTSMPSMATLLGCLGTAVVRSAGGRTLANAADGLRRFLETYAERVLWIRAILDERGMRCTLVALVAIGARLDGTGVVGATVASATVEPIHECAEWAAAGLPSWTRGVVSIAVALLDIFVHATRDGPERSSLSALATSAGITEATVDMHIDAVLAALLPAERAAEYKRVVPRRILRTALAVALGARGLHDAIRKMHTGFAATLLACATGAGA